MTTKRWGYKVIEKRYDIGLGDALRAAGEEGWEVVAVFHGDVWRTAYLKRPLAPQRKVSK